MASAYPPKPPKPVVSEKAIYAMMNIGPKKINKAGKMVGKSIAKRSADSKRKTKEAQSIAMGKIKTSKSVSAQSKRKTGEAISVLGKKKAPSSFALGLLKNGKKMKRGK